MISIVIPTYNRTEMLTKCLTLLIAPGQDFDASAYEIIVSDDSNNKDTENLLKTNFPSVKWVPGPKKGPAANRNNGGKQANGEWLLYIDDDCLPANDLLKNYTNYIESHPGTKIFEGCILAEGVKRSFLDESPVNETGGFLWSCNFMIEKHFFLDTLEGFDEHFPYASMEDVDLHYRIQKTGERIVFVTTAIVRHPWREQKALLQMTEKRFQSTLYFLKKHPEKRDQWNSFKIMKRTAKMLFHDVGSNLFKLHFRGVRLYMQNYFYDLYLTLKEDRKFRRG